MDQDNEHLRCLKSETEKLERLARQYARRVRQADTSARRLRRKLRRHFNETPSASDDDDDEHKLTVADVFPDLVEDDDFKLEYDDDDDEQGVEQYFDGAQPTIIGCMTAKPVFVIKDEPTPTDGADVVVPLSAPHTASHAAPEASLCDELCSMLEADEAPASMILKRKRSMNDTDGPAVRKLEDEFHATADADKK